MKKLKKRVCLVPGCGRGVFSRGLCKGHYIYAARLVRKGGYDWVKLEKKGKVLAPMGGTRAQALRDWFDSR